MIREMLKKYAQPEAGTIRFSKKDLERMPEGFETEIQNIAGEKGGSLALEKIRQVLGWRVHPYI